MPDAIFPPMTADEFLRAYGEDGDQCCELIEGEICERGVNGYSHDRVKNNFAELFGGALDEQSFEAWIAHSFQLDHLSIVTPDVAIIRAERLKNRSGNFPTRGAPELPFEVAFSDRATVSQRKISAYLRSGAHAVCCVYPEFRRIVVYTAHEWRELTINDTLEFPDLLPGVAIPISAVFEGV